MEEETKPRASVIIFDNGISLFDDDGLNDNRTIKAIISVLSEYDGGKSFGGDVGCFCARIFREISDCPDIIRDGLQLRIDNEPESYYNDMELIVRINFTESSIEIVRVSGQSKTRVTEVNCSFETFTELFNV